MIGRNVLGRERSAAAVVWGIRVALEVFVVYYAHDIMKRGFTFPIVLCTLVFFARFVAGWVFNKRFGSGRRQQEMFYMSIYDTVSMALAYSVLRNCIPGYQLIHVGALAFVLWRVKSNLAQPLVFMGFGLTLLLLFGSPVNFKDVLFGVFACIGRVATYDRKQISCWQVGFGVILLFLVESEQLLYLRRYISMSKWLRVVLDLILLAVCGGGSELLHLAYYKKFHGNELLWSVPGTVLAGSVAILVLQSTLPFENPLISCVLAIAGVSCFISYIR
mmetsp:Transcript_29946/g.47579  ORF Transcript_29946/g.47579 Transcript_29946/m.47579 type:complete len:275 (-) Transcript_29946:1589-2413(-)|eukprot:CAMPEP_0203751726 /NCGR_PEP_ID=MMETSP0098-20131031/5755_1 /ASSEMBLY_ACC=CAM_ASM_000208 /TAXON_ID=96639 /ORGANISM=" , Strain NY0313808BC1" /LENGTH=274 /DNA_ID=CAMNT_0050641591 /DNA_START=142 /DNA_END=966 /DNA_ORIENTATION=-